ncbi:grasp-with-spasm system ATP-grasp peptide maturase [Rhizosphaericola mali]|uniref:Grasp-with-spasm system ATP-grasp peptide maturase n=1 Tax=Rhizosphaericola mali TaxID=2545455 RepID=A0A5P2FVU0_9BACT|nr:grasp-with-spasm system ATP-grasp peptide maturase [Rhizosphaericola mali]QES87626.1 grasp-with-spasm system ATP-grasp peptide maturase [Rhizosphaericola mali]
MILILSRVTDHSSTLVLEWLKSLKEDVIRINGDKPNDMTLLFCNLNENKTIIEHLGKEINLLDFNSIWYRRRPLSIDNFLLNKNDSLNKRIFFDNMDYQKGHIKKEIDTLINFIYYKINSAGMFVLGDPNKGNLNKLEVLNMAQKVGLKIPQTYIISQKEQLIKLMENNSSFITKAMKDSVYLITKQFGYYTYTERITSSLIHKLPDSFPPSLIQQEITKKYEIRSFYLNGRFYSMVIFSQSNKKTEVDFRKYSHEKINRYVPFNLPDKIEKKLLILMNDELKLNTGSIDIIVDKNDNYIFLEVNPVGQFTMTSLPCNYLLEKKIAELLCQKQN